MVRGRGRGRGVYDAVLSASKLTESGNLMSLVLLRVDCILLGEGAGPETVLTHILYMVVVLSKKKRSVEPFVSVLQAGLALHSVALRGERADTLSKYGA